ncbi:MAG: GNAT family protein, partial [Pseudomonadota bacterium]|nr:GNAT family protein [Pseudomonadota bacterium]
MAPNFPIIPLDESFELREIRVSDAHEYYKYINDDKVKMFVPTNCLPHNEAKAVSDLIFLINLFKQKRGIYWAIANKSNDKLVGTCGYETWYRSHARLELVYDLAPEFWGQNLMNKALKKIINFAFQTMPVNRIEAITTPDNHKSIKVLKRLNFSQDGLLRQYRYF